MKQQTSILQWATLMINEDVKGLNSIQDVKFLKNLLWKIDSLYFSNWQSGKGSQSFTQVIDQIGTYFKNQIGTDIQQYIETLNAYKNPMDLWELLLGIAIKGNNRGNNIALILDMNHGTQAQLVGIVSGIIDKYGQNAAQTNVPQIQQEISENQPPINQRQMLMDLIKQNQQMTEKIRFLDLQHQRQKIQLQSILNQKKDLQHQLQIQKLQKRTFLQIFANANRNDSRIFDDGQQTVLNSGNLSQLANDIIVFMRDLKKRLAEQGQRVTILQQELRQTKLQANRAIQENQSYLLQLGNLNAYQNQIDQLRFQINQVFNQNSQLIERNTKLQKQNNKLIFNFQKNAKQQPLQPEVNSLDKNQQISLNKKTSKHGQHDQQIHSSEGSDSPKKLFNASLNSQGGQSQSSKHQIGDELKEPKLRRKLQRQINYLKANNQNLKKQNISLKEANQSLQQSAKSFLQGNQAISSQWQSDIQQIMSIFNQITSESNTNSREGSLMKKDSLNIKNNSQHSNHIVQQQFIQQQKYPQVQQQQLPQFRQVEDESKNTINIDTQTNNFDANMQIQLKKVQIWKQVEQKIKGILSNCKQKELAYENTILCLKNQNIQLLQSFGEKGKNSVKESNQNQYNIQILSLNNNQKADPAYQLTFRANNNINQDISQSQAKKLVKFSYLSIQQGQDIDDSVIKRRDEGNSVFFNANSRLIAQIKQHEVRPPNQYENNLLNVNRKLFNASKSNLINLRHQINDSQINNTLQLSQKLNNQIFAVQAHYQALNQSYQQIFNRLNIYTDRLRSKQVSNIQGFKLLQRLQSTQDQAKASQQSQIIRINEVNSYLRSALAESAAQKQQLFEMISQMTILTDKMKGNNQNIYEDSFQRLLAILEELKINFNVSMQEPLSFLQLRLEADKEGEVQKFYKMYIKQKQKSRSLSVQLQLLSNVLLQYRNIIQS